MNDIVRRGLIVAGFCGLPWLVFGYWFDPEHGKLIGNDMLAYSFKQEYYFQVSFKNGYLPLWTPEILGGMPSAQLIVGQPFFPLSLLKLAIPGYFDGGHLRAFLAQKLLLLSLGGLAFYDFLRRKRLPRSAALLGASLFLFNSRMLDGIRYGTSFDAFVLVAPMLALIERALVGGFAPRLVLLVAPVVACQALAGYPQMLVYSVGLTNAYCAYRLIAAVRDRETSPASAVRAGAWFVSAQALGLAMAAVSLLPFAVDVLPHVRRNASFEFSTQNQAAWSDLAWSASYPWLADVHSAFYSSSIATILLVLLAAGWRGHGGQEAASTRRDLLFFAATVVVCVAIALGSHTPLFELLWRFVPGFNINRAPGRLLIVAQVAVATLCAVFAGAAARAPDRTAALLLGVGRAFRLLRAPDRGRGAAEPRLGRGGSPCHRPVRRAPLFRIPPERWHRAVAAAAASGGAFPGAPPRAGRRAPEPKSAAPRCARGAPRSRRSRGLRLPEVRGPGISGTATTRPSSATSRRSISSTRVA